MTPWDAEARYIDAAERTWLRCSSQLLLSSSFLDCRASPPGLTAPWLLQRALIPPLAPPSPRVQPTLDLAHTDAIGCPHEPNLVWGQSEMRRASPGTLGEGCFNGFFVLCILSFLVLPPLSSFMRRNNEVVSLRLITRENLFTWSYQWSVRLSIGLPVIQERKSITGESDQ